MDKIASPEELTTEIRTLLAYAEGENPSREKLAADLTALAERVGGTEKTASGQDLFHMVVPQRAVMKMYSRLEDEDDQSAKLYQEVVSKLMDMLDMNRGAQEALRRIQDVSDRGQNWDIALIRNNIFKAANAMGIRLPSGMF